MKRAVLWDSSAVLALIDADDADHRRALVAAGAIAAARQPGFLTNYLEVEAHALLLRRLGRSLAREWLLSGGLPVVRVSPREEQLGKEILVRHADKDFSLCDAISFAVMELRGVRAAFSFDRHFGQYCPFQVVGP
jgi:predicted nucleic acid-binding protein